MDRLMSGWIDEWVDACIRRCKGSPNGLISPLLPIEEFGRQERLG